KALFLEETCDFGPVAPVGGIGQRQAALVQRLKGTLKQRLGCLFVTYTTPGIAHPAIRVERDVADDWAAVLGIEASGRVEAGFPAAPPDLVHGRRFELRQGRGRLIVDFD